MDNSLIVNERKSFSDLLRPLIYFFNDSRIRGFCWSCFWVIEDLTLQVSFALFHYQDHSCGVRALEKGCAIKLYSVGMLQFSVEQNEKKHAIWIQVLQNWLYKNCHILSCVFLSNLMLLTNSSAIHTRDKPITLNLIK